jgi:hypothetical protein
VALKGVYAMSYLTPPTADPIVQWQGRSGRWYPFSVMSFASIFSWPDREQCVYIFARQSTRHSGLRDPLYIGEKGETDRFANHDKLDPARRLGAIEFHVHLLATSRRERLDIETDLRHGHWTPLNEQLTPAPKPGLGSLADLFRVSGPSTYSDPVGGLGDVLRHVKTTETPGLGIAGVLQRDRTRGLIGSDVPLGSILDLIYPKR